MKHTLARTCIAALVTLLLALVCAGALAGVPATSAYFEDPNFLAYVRTFDTSGDNYLSDDELRWITSIECQKRGIKSLKGIDYFPALRFLYCQENSIRNLDLSGCKNLASLRCSDNQLETLDIYGCSQLQYINCENNKLTSLDVSGCPLESLDCEDNCLTSLTLGSQQWLETLYCRHNNLDQLDISKCRFLDKLVPDGESDSNWGYFADDWCTLFMDLTTKAVTSKGTYSRIKGITLNKTKDTLIRTGKNPKPTLQLKATITPAKVFSKKLFWWSSNDDVAKVNSNGKVTALKAGTAVITCETCDGTNKKATFKITVKDTLVSKITLNKTKATLKVKGTLQLKVKKFSPASPVNQTVKWTSSNKKIAKVDKNGKVTALKTGTCTITCTATDKSKKHATCKITVK